MSSILNWKRLKRIRGLHFTQRTWEKITHSINTTQHTNILTLNSALHFGGAHNILKQEDELCLDFESKTLQLRADNVPYVTKELFRNIQQKMQTYNASNDRNQILCHEQQKLQRHSPDEPA